MKFLGSACLLIVLVVAYAQLTKTETSSPPTSNSAPSEYQRMRAARENVALKDFKWSKSQFGIMTAQFTFENKNDFGVKDVEVRCDHSGPSGTKIDSNLRTIYEIIPARASRTFREFNMGFVHSQAASSACRIVDIAIASGPRPAPKPAAKAGAAKPTDGKPLSLSP